MFVKSIFLIFLLLNTTFAEEYTQQDESKAVQLYSEECFDGFLPSCSKLADLFIFGKGVKQDYNKALQLLTLSCNNPSTMETCSKLGVMYDNGFGIKQDSKKAKELYKKACDIGYKQGCRNYFNSIKNEID